MEYDMNIIFLGTPDFSVPSLHALHEHGHDISLVITRPDRPRGRGRKPSPPPVKKAAHKLGLDIFQPQSVNSATSFQKIQKTGADIGITVAYGEILDPEILEAPPQGFLNLHASLLPKYRGAAPIHWAIIRGEDETGVTVQRMVQKMDAGPILKQRSAPIDNTTTVGSLHDELAKTGASTLADVVDSLDEGAPLEEVSQNEEDTTYAPKLSKSDGKIDWDQSADYLARFVRGVTPWPGAHTVFIGQDHKEKVTVTRAEPGSASSTHKPGTVVEANSQDGLGVQTNGAILRIQRIKPANSRTMDATDFINGYRVEPGDRFE